ncbi:14444_t:CDS:2, partial [Gigaspora margarita]
MTTESKNFALQKIKVEKRSKTAVEVEVTIRVDATYKVVGTMNEKVSMIDLIGTINEIFARSKNRQALKNNSDRG